MGGPRAIGALSNFLAYRATLLYFYFITHENVLAMLHIRVEQVAAPISIWQ